MHNGDYRVLYRGIGLTITKNTNKTGPFIIQLLDDLLPLELVYINSILLELDEGTLYASYDERIYCTPVMMRGPIVCQL